MATKGILYTSWFCLNETARSSSWHEIAPVEIQHKSLLLWAQNRCDVIRIKNLRNYLL